MLISGSIFDMCRIRGDGKKFVSISDLSLKFNGAGTGTVPVVVRVLVGIPTSSTLARVPFKNASILFT